MVAYCRMSPSPGSVSWDTESDVSLLFRETYCTVPLMSILLSFALFKYRWGLSFPSTSRYQLHNIYSSIPTQPKEYYYSPQQNRDQ